MKKKPIKVSNDNKKLFFLSCDTNKQEIKRIEEVKQIISIYHVCGSNPWLLVCKFPSIQKAVSISKKYHLNIIHMSIAPIPDTQKRIKCSPVNNKIKFWIFINVPKTISTNNFLRFVDDPKWSEQITEKYELFGVRNFNAVVKFYAININGIDEFIEQCRQKGMSTSTKCVLSTIKENRKITPLRIIEKKKTEARNVSSDLPYVLAKIMANTDNFIGRDRNDQILHIKNVLEQTLKMKINPGKYEGLIPHINYGEPEYSKNDLNHPNKLIDRYSVKLEKNMWLKTLLFFKAYQDPMKKDELRKALRDELLGVDDKYFSRKLYHMAGEFDFAVPLDCKDLEQLDLVINKFLKEKKDLINSHRIVICGQKGQGKPDFIELLDIPFIKALLINSTDMSKFKHEINTAFRDKTLNFGRRPQISLAETDITPREDFVRREIWKINEIEEGVINSHLANFNFKQKGIESTIEFKDSELFQVLFRFYPKEYSLKKTLSNKIAEKAKQYGVIVSIYNPVRDPSLICIFAVKDLDELLLIFDDYDEFCTKIEFHLVFHQDYYSKVIEKEIRCRPCFYHERYFERTRGHGGCGECINYVIPRKRNRILNVNLKEKIKSDIKISIICMNMELYQYFLLEKNLEKNGLDEKYKRLDEQDGYKEFADKIGEYAEKHIRHFKDGYVKYNQVITNGINIDDYRNSYRKDVLKIIQYLTTNNSDIIIFPEYSIFSYIYKDIKEEKYSKDCLIVAGSHIDRDKFSVCPILFYKHDNDSRKIFHYYRNHISPTCEQVIDLMQRRGTGYVKFMNSKYGNLFFNVCYDTYGIDPDPWCNNVDFYIVPSFNASSLLTTNFTPLAQNRKLIVAYVNAPNMSLNSAFFVPPNDGRYNNSRGLEPFHRDQWPSKTSTLTNGINVIEEYPDSEALNTQLSLKSNLNITAKHLLVKNLVELDIRRSD